MHWAYISNFKFIEIDALSKFPLKHCGWNIGMDLLFVTGCYVQSSQIQVYIFCTLLGTHAAKANFFENI